MASSYNPDARYGRAARPAIAGRGAAEPAENQWKTAALPGMCAEATVREYVTTRRKTDRTATFVAADGYFSIPGHGRSINESI